MTEHESASFVSSLPFRPGWVLGGRYRLGVLIGRGGMAEVHRAQDEVLQRAVAVKLFHRDAGVDDDDARQSVEVRALAQLHHRGIVGVYDAGTDETCPGDPRSYLVLELVDGQTLGQRLTGGPMPSAEVASIGAQLAAALAHVHARDIVHRDVKPANILLARGEHPDESTVAKLTDFGVARFLNGARMTMFGMTVGTANYLSPEQALGQDVIAASDIYSLGLVLLEALTGRRAFPGHGVEAALQRLHRDPDIPAALGRSWGAVLVAMTARDPGHRPTAFELERALRALPQADLPKVFDGTDESTDHLGPLPGIAWQAGPDGNEACVARSGGRHRLRPGAVASIGAVGTAVAAAVILTLVGAGQPTAADAGAPETTAVSAAARDAGSVAVINHARPARTRHGVRPGSRSVHTGISRADSAGRPAQAAVKLAAPQHATPQRAGGQRAAARPAPARPAPARATKRKHSAKKHRGRKNH